MPDHSHEPPTNHGGMGVPQGGAKEDAKGVEAAEGQGVHKPHDEIVMPKDSPEPAKQHGAHAGMAMGGMTTGGMVSPVTRPQVFAVALTTVLALSAAVLFSAMRVNLRLSARDVGGSVMPPGMIMTYDTPGKAMRDMAAVDPRTVSYTAPTDARGDQLLQPRIQNGVKLYDLSLSVIKWNILPDVQVMAYAFNHQVPGPRIRITEGDHVRITVTNNLPEPTTVHWHGLIVPNDMDGPAEITQKPILPGQSYPYEFTAKQYGTYFYHSHREPDRQQTLGMYGALIIDPKEPGVMPPHDLEYVVQLQEWLYRQGYTYPAMIMEGGLPNFFTINGKAYPATDTIHMKVGQKLLLRFIGSSNNFIHPMHVHGGPFRIVATDGNPVPDTAQIEKDTINVAPGERYDVIWPARVPGKWLLHCHIPHHTTNNNVEEKGGGGLTLVILVSW